MAGHEKLLDSVTRFPFPIAVAVREAVRGRSPDQAFSRITSAAEHTAIFLGAVALAQARSAGVAHEVVAAWATKAMQGGLAFGTWIESGREAARACATAGVDELDIAALFKPGSAAMTKLDQLTRLRNDKSHGGGMWSTDEVDERVGAALELLEQMLVDLAALADLRLLVLQRCRRLARAARYQIDADEAMGDNSRFLPLLLEANDAFAEGTVVVQQGERILDLTPFVVQRTCAQCHLDELFYVSRVKKKRSADLISFDRGHVEVDDGVAEEVGLLRQEPQVAPSRPVVPVRRLTDSERKQRWRATTKPFDDRLRAAHPDVVALLARADAWAPTVGLSVGAGIVRDYSDDGEGLLYLNPTSARLDLSLLQVRRVRGLVDEADELVEALSEVLGRRVPASKPLIKVEEALRSWESLEPLLERYVGLRRRARAAR